MNQNGINIIGVIVVAAFIFAISLGFDLALVALASLVSGIDASFRELLGASIIVAAAQSSVSVSPPA